MKFKTLTYGMLALLLVSIFGFVGCGNDKPTDTLLVNRNQIDPNNLIYSFGGGNIAIRLEGAQQIRATFVVSNGRVVGGSWAPNADPSRGGVFCNQSLQTVQLISQAYSNACGFAYGLADGYVLVQAPYAEEKSALGTVTTIKYVELFGKLKDGGGLILRKSDAYVSRFDYKKTKFDLTLPVLNNVSIKVDDDGIEHYFRFEVYPYE